MRQYIDLVSNLFEEAEVIQFRRAANTETPSRIDIFSPDSKFTIVVTKETQSEGEYHRAFVMKRHGLTLAGLMHFFKSYNVSPMAPDERRYWQSANPPKVSYDMQPAMYDLHVFMDEHTALDLEQFNAINRMIKNSYTVPLVYNRRA
jgi:hypothetical protein